MTTNQNEAIEKSKSRTEWTSNHDIWCQLYQLQSINLFGFVARNQATMSSDVDV